MAETEKAKTRVTDEMALIFRPVSDDRDAVLKRQRTMDEVMGTAGSLTRSVEMSEEVRTMETVGTTEPATSPELGTPLVEGMMKVPEAMYRK